MFANALLECAPNVQARRRWILLFSLAVQLSIVSLALLYPLLHPERLPFISTVPRIELQAPMVVRVVPAENQGFRSNLSSQLQWPQQLSIRHSDASPVSKPVADNLPPENNLSALIGAGSSNANVIGNVLNTHGPAVVRAAPPHTKPFPVSHLEEGRLLQKIQPIYPVPARLGPHSRRGRAHRSHRS